MRREAGILIACVLLLAAPVRGELSDAEVVMDRLSKVLADLRDVSADVQVQTAGRQASGRIVLQYLRRPSDEGDGPKETTRRYIVVTRRKIADKQVRVRQVNDGRTLWVEVTYLDTGKVIVTRRGVAGKGAVPGGLGHDWRSELKQLRRRYVFKTVGEGRSYDEPVVLLEGRLRELPPEEKTENGKAVTWPERVTLAVSKRDHFPRKVTLVVRPGEGRRSVTVAVTLTGVKVNAGLKADTFDYRVPAGATVKDVE